MSKKASKLLSMTIMLAMFLSLLSSVAWAASDVLSSEDLINFMFGSDTASAVEDDEDDGAALAPSADDALSSTESESLSPATNRALSGVDSEINSLNPLQRALDISLGSGMQMTPSGLSLPHSLGELPSNAGTDSGYDDGWLATSGDVKLASYDGENLVLTEIGSRKLHYGDQLYADIKFTYIEDTYYDTPTYTWSYGFGNSYTDIYSSTEPYYTIGKKNIVLNGSPEDMDSASLTAMLGKNIRLTVTQMVSGSQYNYGGITRFTTEVYLPFGSAVFSAPWDSDSLTFTYNGCAQKPTTNENDALTATLSGADFTIPSASYALKYKTSSGETTNSINAGEYSVFVYGLDETFYDGEHLLANYIIVPKSLTADSIQIDVPDNTGFNSTDASLYSIPYDSQQHALPIVVKDTEHDESGVTLTTNDYTVYYKESSSNDWSTIAPSEAGTYQIKIKGKNNYTDEKLLENASFSITQASIPGGSAGSSPSVSIEDWVYGESANTPSVSVGLSLDAYTVTYKYFTQGDPSQSLGNEAPKAAGSYTLKATIHENSGNYDDATVSANFTIAKRKITIKATDASKIYGEENPEFSYNTSLTDAFATDDSLVYGDTISVVLTCDATATSGISKAAIDDTSAVSYSIVPSNVVIKNSTIDVTDNYEIMYSSGVLAINPRPVKVTANSASKTYDGTALTETRYDVEPYSTGRGLLAGHVLTATTSGSITNVGTVNNTIEAVAIKAGSEEAAENLTENYVVEKIFGTLTITKASLSAEESAEEYKKLTINAYSDTYDGQEHSIPFTAPSGVTLKFYKDSNRSQEVSAFKDVSDSGTVYYTATGDNFNDYPGETSVTISQKPVTVTGGITADNKPYDGNTSAVLSCTNPVFEGLVSGDTLTVNAIGAFTDASVGDGKAVNITQITLGGASAGNYVLATSGNQQTTTASILALDMSSEVSAPQGIGSDEQGYTIITVSYTGSEQTYEVNIPEGATVTYTVDGRACDGIPSHKDVKRGEDGSVEPYIVTYTVTKTGYNTVTGQAKVTITPRNVTVKADDKSKVFNEADPTLTVSITGNLNNDSISYTTLTRESGNDKGSYRISVNGAEAQGNYRVFYEPGVFTINAATVSVSAPTFNDNLVYKGSEQSLLAAEGTTTGGTIEYKVSQNNADSQIGGFAPTDWSTNAPFATHAGSYTIEWEFVPDSNHTAPSNSSGSETVTMAKMPVVVSGIKVTDKVYDGTTSAALDYSEVVFKDESGAALSSTLTNELAGVTASGEFTDAAVGESKQVTISNISLSSAAHANYTLAGEGQQASATGKITPKPISLTWSDGGNNTFTYIYTAEGSAPTACVDAGSLVSSDDCTVTSYTITPNTSGSLSEDGHSAIKVGTYTITASQLSNNNYTPIGATNASRLFVIDPAAPSAPTVSLPDPSVAVVTITIAETDLSQIANQGLQLQYACMAKDLQPSDINWRNAMLASDGTFTISELTTGTYDLYLRYAANAGSNGHSDFSPKLSFTLHAVMYNANGADESTSTVPGPYYYLNSSDSHTVQSKPDSLAKTGHDFQGWNTLQDGTGTDYSADTTLTVGDGITLYAKWKAKTYTVTLEPNDGSVTPSVLTVTYGSKYIGLPSPVRDGYDFAGWYTTLGENIAVASDTAVTATNDHTLYAHWTIHEYTLTYDLADGALPAGVSNPSTYTINNAAITLNNPTKTGYSFAGWTGTGLSLPTMNVTIGAGNIGNRIYTATWTSETYNITYNLDGGALADGVTNPTAYNIETTTFTLNNPSKAGYSFAGWTGTDLNSATTSVSIAKGSTGNRSYSAVWTPMSYSISYDLDGGALAVGVANPSVYNINIEAITLSNPAKIGYSFAGWTGTGLSLPTMSVTIAAGSIGNRNYKATWTSDTYNITYNLGGGALADGVANLTAYNIETTTFTLNNPSKAGYSFAGWTGTGLNSATTSVTIVKGSTGNRSYNATWALESYTINYELDGGIIAGGAENPSAYDINSETITLSNPTKFGYSFAGWTGTELGSATTSVTIAKGSTGNRSYTATWTSNPYTITYNLDGGALASGVTNVTDYNIETATFTLNNPSKAGYSFAGWTGTDLDSATTSVTIASGSTGNRSYAANWSPVTYTVQFNANNGSGEMSSQSFTYDVGQVLTTNTFTREGYNFAGWATSANGEKVYDNAASVSNLTSEANGAVTLYAVWSVISYNVTISSIEHGSINADNTTATYDSEVTLSATPATGYHLKDGSWTVSRTGAQKQPFR